MVHGNFKLISLKLDNGFNLNQTTESKFRLIFRQGEFKTSLKGSKQDSKSVLEITISEEHSRSLRCTKRSQALQERILNQGSPNKIH